MDLLAGGKYKKAVLDKQKYSYILTHDFCMEREKKKLKLHVNVLITILRDLHFSHPTPTGNVTRDK